MAKIMFQLQRYFPVNGKIQKRFCQEEEEKIELASWSPSNSVFTTVFLS
jgi:hypothetical protein